MYLKNAVDISGRQLYDLDMVYGKKAASLLAVVGVYILVTLLLRPG
jgi:hypothetical protein